MNDKVSQAAALFGSGFNCAQSVLAVFSEDYGLSQETALKVASGMGGGVRRGEICGAVTGAVLTIGLKHGQSKAEDKETKADCNQRAEDFLREFEKRNGSVICRDILGCDLSKAEGRQQAQEKGMFDTVCTQMVKNAVELLIELGY